MFSSQDSWVQEIVNRYYDEPGWFELIGISKVKRTLNKDGAPKSLKYIKDMVNRFLDYFGLTTELEAKTETNRIYGIAIPEKVKDFLLDIDDTLNSRRLAVIEVNKEISLKEVSDKAAETQRQQQEWEQKHQEELNKRMLENSIIAETPEILAVTSSIYINQKEELPATEVYKRTDNTEWDKPETLTDLAELLAACDSQEMLAGLRGRDIPPEALKVASRQLPSEKREQIKSWVLASNAV